jgi:hypothetical protein
VILFASANASGANSVAFNHITVTMHTQFGNQTQTLVVVTGQDPSQIGQSPGNTLIVSDTQTQTGIVNPSVDLSLSAEASAMNTVAANLVTVNLATQLGDQSQTLLVEAF